jgi:hypothetical protein
MQRSKEEEKEITKNQKAFHFPTAHFPQLSVQRRSASHTPPPQAVTEMQPSPLFSMFSPFR